MAPTKGDAITALAWAAMAEEYLKGYRAIASGHPDPLDLALVKLQNLGQALECSLKGWLVLHGVSEAQFTKKRRGHDLAWLAEQARRHYTPLAAPEELIKHLTEGYWGGGNRDYEYPFSLRHPRTAWQIAYVPPDELAPVVEECNRVLSSTAHALKPFEEEPVASAALFEELRADMLRAAQAYIDDC